MIGEKTHFHKFHAKFWILSAILLTWWFGFHSPSTQPTLHRHTAPPQAHWIRTTDTTQYTGSFRKDYHLTGQIKSGWIGISSYGGYELLCNGNPVGAQTYWRPTRGFQNGLTERGQKIETKEPIIAYNFPREYQWSGHRNDHVVIFYDLSKHLRKGKNSLCLDIESRLSNPSVIAFGELHFQNGTTQKIHSDSTWLAQGSPGKLRQNHWVNPKVDVQHWPNAVELTGPSKQFLSLVPKGFFALPPPSQWIASGLASKETTWESEFKITSADSSCLKILSHHNYWIWVNGTRLQPSNISKKGYSEGQWLLAWEGRKPLATPPGLLDPDETDSLFGGKRFASPRHGDPTVNDFKRYENVQNRTRDRPNQTGKIEETPDDEPRGREQDPYGFLEEPEAATPHTVVRKRFPAQLHAYDISALLHPGNNLIKIRQLNHNDIGYSSSQGMRVSISGGVINTEGQLTLDFEKLTWNVSNGNSEAKVQQGLHIHQSDLATLKFLGTPQGSPSFLSLFIALTVMLLVSLTPAKYIGQGFTRICFLFVILSILYYILAETFRERSEILWVLQLTNLTVALLWLCSIIMIILRSRSSRLISKQGHYWLCGALLLTTFILRAWNIEHQPIDDDEYASIQACLSIIKTGVPQIAGDIWYSRSPLYHYAAAAFSMIFGGHLAAIRLYSVLLSVLTGWVLWLICARHLRSRLIATIALLIFALHPFLIFSGHIARFYQQQQFTVLLMIYLFIEGFLYTRSKWHRAGAVALFAAATLSQEISISFVPVFFLLYLLFGKGVKITWDVKTLCYIFLAGLLIGLDIALFKVKCLTRSVGVSPNVEATIAPTFWDLGNIASMFIGYSRLHLTLSFFYFISLVYSMRRGAKKYIVLHMVLLISILSFNLLITSSSYRYMYSIIPIWILLGAHGIQVFTWWSSLHIGSRYRPILSLTAVTFVVLSFSPWRILSSYQEKILGDPISALGYVKENFRPNDKVMITEPHPHAAKLEVGQVDYDLVIPILYDFAYNDQGLLRDRNGNAAVVNRLAQLQTIFSSTDRLWIVVNREKFRSRKKNIRWEYPGAREELFLRENCSLEYRSYLWSVFLWDSAEGKLKTFRTEDSLWVE